MYHFLIAESSQMPFLIMFVLLFGAFAAILDLVHRIFLWSKNANKTPCSLGLLVQLEDRHFHDMASRWLSRKLSDSKLCVERAILFGSVVHDHFPTSDVDVIIFAKPMSDKKARRMGRKIKTELCRDFNQTHNHPLHVQLYGASEKGRFEKFLSRQGRWEELRLNGIQ